MKVTDVKIRKLFTEGRVKAIVSITLDDEVAIHDMKVIEGIERLFVAMPNRRSDDGRFQDIAHPISTAARAKIDEAIIDAYNKALAEVEINDVKGEDRL